MKTNQLLVVVHVIFSSLRCDVFLFSLFFLREGKKNLPTKDIKNIQRGHDRRLDLRKRFVALTF